MAYITFDDVKKIEDLASSLAINDGKWTDDKITSVIVLQEAKFNSQIIAYETPILITPIPEIIKLCISNMVAYEICQQGQGTQADADDEYLHLKTIFENIIKDINSGAMKINGAIETRSGVPIVKKIHNVRYCNG